MSQPEQIDPRPHIVIEMPEVPERPASAPIDPHISYEPQVRSFYAPVEPRIKPSGIVEDYTRIDRVKLEQWKIEQSRKLKARFQRIGSGSIMVHLERVPKESKIGCEKQYLNFNLGQDGEQFMRDMVCNWLGGGLPPDAMVKLNEFIQHMVNTMCVSNKSI